MPSVAAADAALPPTMSSAQYHHYPPQSHLYSPSSPPGLLPPPGAIHDGFHGAPGPYPLSPTSALYEAGSPDPRLSGSLADQYAAARGSTTRLPPILQVEKQHVTTSATQAASASRRRNDALFKCPVPGCGSTFTRRFNLRGHLRSHTEERPFVCDWPGCGKGFARQHDCKRHQALHSSKAGTHACAGCHKTFSRMDALNRHLRSDGGAECREAVAAAGGASAAAAARAQQSAHAASPGPSEASSRTPSMSDL